MSELMPWEIDMRQAVTKEKIRRAIASGRSRSIFEGRRLERNRIIKLIEDHGIDQNNRPYFLDLIRLIKGE